MGKALVIKNVNFYENRLATIAFVDKPCRGISLNRSTATITSTLRLTATTVPANTTDEVVWYSTNDRVAMVNNGIVTAYSNGTATIIASCGAYSASCVVTVNIAYTVYKGALITINVAGGQLIDRAADFSTSNAIAMGAGSGTYRAVGGVSAASGIRAIYPIVIPGGSSSIILTMSNDYAPLVVFYDKDEKAVDGSPGGYTDSAKVITGETPTGGTNWSIPAWHFGSQTIQIPDDDGIDSFTLGIYCATQAAYNSFGASDIGITFGV